MYEYSRILLQKERERAAKLLWNVYVKPNASPPRPLPFPSKFTEKYLFTFN